MLTRYRRWVTAVDSTTPDLSSSTWLAAELGKHPDPAAEQHRNQIDLQFIEQSGRDHLPSGVARPSPRRPGHPPRTPPCSTASATPPVTKLKVPLGITSSSRPRWVSTKQATG